MNYAWLGNLFTLHKGHGHMHLIPRYQGTRVFAGTTFNDGRWGKNYVPYADTEKPLKTAHAVRDALREVIPDAVHV